MVARWMRTRYRFERVDNGLVEWYDLDLPNVIELRRKLIGEQGERYHLLNISVFEPAWLELVRQHCPRPFLFLAEGGAKTDLLAGFRKPLK